MPVYGQLCKITKSTQLAKQRDNNGFIFHIHLNGRYGEYQVNGKNAKTLNLRCVNSRCGALFSIETPFNEKIGVKSNGKSKFGIRSDVPVETMMDVSMYGSVFHNGAVQKTVHLENCKYDNTNNGAANHRGVSNKLKTRRKTDTAINAAAIVDEEIAKNLNYDDVIINFD